jgi:hypothetical protein
MFSRFFKKKTSKPQEAINKPAAATGAKKLCLTINASKEQENFKTIVVLGVERGGTSMAAGIIRALGVDMGRRAGLNHEDPRFITEDEGKLVGVIKARNEEASVWGFKMPKAVNKLEFFEQHLRNPYYIVVHRNLAAVADSWNQRGAGQYLDVIERALDYHRLIVDHLRQTKRPALIINYERSVRDKDETVREIAGFLDLSVDEEAIKRAVEMITGDGKGYVNLPEHFFNVEPATAMPNKVLIQTTDNLAEIVDADGWITFENLKKKLVLRLSDGSNLPKKFWLQLEIDAAESIDMASLPLRIYFDFIGEMFPGHCARPLVRRGMNSLLVETSGYAQAIGFGPLQAGVRFKLHPALYNAGPKDSIDVITGK